MNMTYYMMLTNDIKGTFGSGASKQSIIAALRKGGKSDFTKFLDEADLVRVGKKLKMDSKYALLLGTDKQSRQQLEGDLRTDLKGKGLDEITLRVPKLKEWLACVTLVDTDKPSKSKPPQFQVVALVGSGALKAAGVDWTQEDSPPEPWLTHTAGYLKPGDTKPITDIDFGGRGGWS